MMLAGGRGPERVRWDDAGRWGPPTRKAGHGLAPQRVISDGLQERSPGVINQLSSGSSGNGWIALPWPSRWAVGSRRCRGARSGRGSGHRIQVTERLQSRHDSACAWRPVQPTSGARGTEAAQQWRADAQRVLRDDRGITNQDDPYRLPGLRGPKRRMGVLTARLWVLPSPSKWIRSLWTRTQGFSAI